MLIQTVNDHVRMRGKFRHIGYSEYASDIL
jgi:hypothetical protein